MEILAAPYTTGVLACVAVIRNLIRNKRCFWSSISSCEVKGFELSHFWQMANFSHTAAF